MPRIKTDHATKSNDQGRHYTPIPHNARAQLRDPLTPVPLATRKTSRIEGRTAQVGLVRERESESYFLDFKRSSDNGVGGRLSGTDRNNLAKAISGFGNSEGGVIVWGVECSDSLGQGDVAQAKVPIQDAAAFRARLEGAVSGCTIAAHDGVASNR